MNLFGGRGGYGNGKGAAFALGGAHGDWVVEHAADPVYDGQAKAKTVFITPMPETAELLKDVCQLLFGHAWAGVPNFNAQRSEEHTSELQSRPHIVCRLLLEKKK